MWRLLRLFTTASKVTFALDAAGNLASDGLRTFEYGADNRLTKVRLTQDGEAASASYDHNGRASGCSRGK